MYDVLFQAIQGFCLNQLDHSTKLIELYRTLCLFREVKYFFPRIVSTVLWSILRPFPFLCLLCNWDSIKSYTSTWAGIEFCHNLHFHVNQPETLQLCVLVLNILILNIYKVLHIFYTVFLGFFLQKSEYTVFEYSYFVLFHLSKINPLPNRGPVISCRRLRNNETV